MQTIDLCFFIQSVSDWNLPQIKFRILQKLVSFPVQFSRCVEVSCEPSKRYRQEIQSDALASLSLCLSYLIGLTAHLSIRSPFSVDPESFQVSVAIFISTLNSSLSTLYQPIDLRTLSFALALLISP